MKVTERIDALADRLARNGELTDGAWRAVLHAVPRHLFVPDVAWAAPDGRPGYRIDRTQDPDAWWEAAYADQPIITQFDDGTIGTIGTDGEPGDFTSSLSAPGVVVDFLELLDPLDGDRVLEIGTGTGWTAALLASRLGDENITSIEIDETAHQTAADNLTQAGFAPRLIHGDGAQGEPQPAVYDRIHVTCGVREVPYAWIQQTRPGGLIVFPWMPYFEPGHKARLIVADDGTATGRFTGGCRYMMLRAQRTPHAPAYQGAYRKRQTKLDPRLIFRAGHGADVAIAASLPDVAVVHSPNGTWLWTETSGAHSSGADVEQFGDRNLWDELEAAFFRWTRWGRPKRDRFGITIAPEGQHIWLDSPGDPIARVAGAAQHPSR